MRSLITPSLTLLVAATTLVACRDAGNKLTRPNFDAISDTSSGCGPGVCQFNTSGASGQTTWFIGTAPDSGGGGFSYQYGGISVSRGGSPSNPQVFLQYEMGSCNQFSCTTLRAGYGTIPVGDFSGNGGALSVNTNTTGNANFYTYAGPTGVVTASWQSTGIYQVSSNGTQTITTPTFRQRSVGQSDFTYASTSGSIVGLSIPSQNSGSISSNRSVSITISH